MRLDPIADARHVHTLHYSPADKAWPTPRERAAGERFAGVSPNDSRFDCRIESQVREGGLEAVVPSLSDPVWITGMHQHTVDPEDPSPEGDRLSDAWPRMGGAERERRVRDARLQSPAAARR